MGWPRKDNPSRKVLWHRQYRAKLREEQLGLRHMVPVWRLNWPAPRAQ
jgi:hypothetical protein